MEAYFVWLLLGIGFMSAFNALSKGIRASRSWPSLIRFATSPEDRKILLGEEVGRRQTFQWLRFVGLQHLEVFSYLSLAVFSFLSASMGMA